MKYVMTEAVAPEGMALLDQSEKVYVAHDANPANYTEEMKDADALIVRAAPAKIVNKAVMEAAPRLKVIGRTGVGYDSVDVDAATELGIPVVITPGANNRAVAEHSLTLMLALSKNLVEAQVEASNSNMVTNEKNKEKLYLIPKTRVLIESDGPFTKIDGKKYTFNNLIKIYELVARYYNEPDIIKMVYANFRDILSK